MEKEFIPYEQAIALKELGFDQPCLGIHYNEGLNPSFIVASQYGEHGATANGGILAPLYQQAFRWFRKKYRLHTWIYQVEDGKFFFSCLKNGRYLVCNSIKFTTYEEAEQECLIKLIELSKEGE